MPDDDEFHPSIRELAARIDAIDDPFERLQAIRRGELALSRKLPGAAVTIRCGGACDGLVARASNGSVEWRWNGQTFEFPLAADVKAWGLDTIDPSCRKCGRTYSFVLVVAAVKAARRQGTSTRRMSA